MRIKLFWRKNISNKMFAVEPRLFDSLILLLNYLTILRDRFLSIY
jgi:hypothetical protein